MRKLTYYVGVTIDGFIAAPGGDFGFFPVTQPLIDFIVAEFPETLPTHARAQLGVVAPGHRFDTVIMGRSTYSPALDVGIVSPYAHLRQYVVSSTLPASDDPAVTVVGQDPVGLIRGLKQESGSGIWLAGGGRLAGALLGEIDELVIKRYPLVIGAGIPMIACEQSQVLPFTSMGTRDLAGAATVTTYTRTRV